MEITQINKIISEMQADFDAIAMPRSAYVLENLVVKVHEHPSVQWLHCVLEMRIKYNNIRRSQIQREIALKEIDKLEAGNEIDQLKAGLKRIDLEELEHTELGTIREFFSLYKIYSTLPRFTREEIEAAQSEYWFKRLAKQSLHDVLATGRISQGNLEALRQAHIDWQMDEKGVMTFFRNGKQLEDGE